MKQYRCIIIDDEENLQEVLQIKLERFCPQIEVVGTAMNAWDAYDIIIEKKPDIIFLDIAMPAQSGFDLLKKFDKIDFEIIFITGFDKYGLQALKMSATDYLLKPVRTQELKDAVQKAIHNVENRQKLDHYEILKHNIDNPTNQDIKISIPYNGNFVFIKISDIIHIEGWQKYTKVYLQSGECLTSSYNIGHYKELLQSYHFSDVHKSHIINNLHIASYDKNGIITLSDGSQVPVARRKKEAFFQSVIQKQ